MNVRPVHVSRYDECMLSLRPAHRRLVTDSVRLFRRHLARFERLANLISQHILPVLKSVPVQILPFHQKKLSVASLLIAFIRTHKLAAIRLFSVFGVVGSFFKAPDYGFAFVVVQGYASGGCHGVGPPIKVICTKKERSIDRVDASC